MKQFKTLPVYIVENHNEVVPHIHRSIGSKHLPTENIALIHFDSHPDLLIPFDMLADDVYDKEKLYDCQSIENWIMPAMYAGHISDIFWLKAPWADQMQDQTVEFYVGKSVDTGFIRTSCTENYFVSETLYLPENKMVNKRRVRLTVLTVEPAKWSSVASDPSGGDNSSSTSIQKSPNATSLTKSKIEGNRLSDVDASIGHVKSERDSKRPKNDNEQSGLDKLDSEPVVKKTKIDLTQSSDSPKEKKLLGEDSLSAQTHDNHNGEECLSDKSCVLSLKFINHLKQIVGGIENQAFVLDIDLDFFSTKNPFRELYGEDQYRLIRELYEYEKPVEASVEALESCTSRRSKQLSDLKAVFSQLSKDDSPCIDHPRKTQIQSLVTGLRSTSTGPVDFELLHEAGCTCDDTDLPHHVSSSEQIIELVDAMQEIICHFRKPTIVTISRSSHDDYCPREQVDFIQDKVVEMLQDLYLEISVIMDYENSSDN
ncbi:hypothetical protein ScPMuIL_000039 [Solemya velum]